MERPVVIAAGGTGGHFFPAQALASVLAARGRRVVLLTDARSSAAKSEVFAEVFVVAGAGIAGRTLFRAAKGALAIARGVAAARSILKRLDASVVVGFGGFPAVAPVLAGRLLRRRPVLILHDQNAVLGKANRFLSRFADVVATSFAQTGGVPAELKTLLTGNPVRGGILPAPYEAPVERIRLLVLGGSLGAKIFATLMPEALALLPVVLREKIDLTMQCPAGVLEAARAALTGGGVPAVLAPFFENVAELLKEAHLVVARSGGSTVAELAVVGRPAVLIPLTINADQRANAAALAQAGGAVVVEQGEGAAALARVLEELLMSPKTLVEMAAGAARMGIVDAAEKLADLVEREMVF